jgi:hypothetical protein
MVMKWKSFLWIPVLAVSVLLNIFFLFRTHSTMPGVKVIGVIDGDTFILESNKAKIRLRYVDAPELAFCGGQEAKAELEKLVVGKQVRIEEQIPDQYGRGMALVYIGNDCINQKMLASGWARYHHDNTKRGIYAKCQSQDVQDDPACFIKGNIDKNSDARTYYLPACAQYKFTIVEKDTGENWFCTEKEAITAGFKKAATCKQ